MIRIATTALLALALLAPLGGCDVTEAGKSGNLAFRYDTHDSLLPSSFNADVARGMKVDVIVTDNVTGDRVTVSSATTSPSSVLSVAGTSGSTVTLEGQGVGQAELTVRTRDASDAIDIDVAEIATADLGYPGVLLENREPPVAVVQGEAALLLVTLKDDRGARLVGYGDVPMTISPDGAAVVSPTNDVSHASVTFVQTGDVTVTGLNDDPLTLTVIPAGDVESVALESLTGATPITVQAGNELPMALRGRTADGTPVFGVAADTTLTPQDTAICTVSLAERLGEGAYNVDARSSGACVIDVSWGGLTSTVTIEIER